MKYFLNYFWVYGMFWTLLITYMYYLVSSLEIFYVYFYFRRTLVHRKILLNFMCARWSWNINSLIPEPVLCNHCTIRTTSVVLRILWGCTGIKIKWAMFQSCTVCQNVSSVQQFFSFKKHWPKHSAHFIHSSTNVYWAPPIHLTLCCIVGI